jgi:glutaredoxin
MKFATMTTWGLALLLCAGTASAQMYKWVDASGKTHFTDTPPPAAAKTAPMKSGAAGSSGANLPYALANAVRAFPVVIWTTSPCPSCDSGRAYLKSRGIPFSEKTVTSDADEAKLRESGGNDRLPFLMVGRNKVIGFQQGAWSDALTAASYPERSMLPSNYQYGAATSGAPRQTQAEPDKEALRMAAAEAEAEEARKKKAAAPTAPPGFQF